MKKTLIFLLIIIALAAFFRLWQLDSIPPGLYPDEAINANEAVSDPGKVFYPENNGREGLFINLLSLSFSIFGISIWSLKIVPALIGILTVLGLYLLAKELFCQYSQNCSRYIALLSSFFLAVSFWHVNFSRIDFRAILVPFILVFSFYFLFKGFRQKRVYNFILAGLFFGLGFYTYISFRLAVLLLFTTLILWFLVYQKQKLQKEFMLHTSYFLLLIFLIALPIGLYFLQNPGDFISRAGGVSVFAAKNPLGAFAGSLGRHLLMFNFEGDPNWRHNFAGSPQLFWPVGILFLIGLAFSVREIINFRKHKNSSLVISHLSLAIWFIVMLLPGVLSAEGLPHSLRVIGVIPAVYIFAGLGGWKVCQVFAQNTKRRKLLIFASLLFLFAVAFSQFNKYFISWAQNPHTEGAFAKDYVEIGDYLNSLPPEIPKYVIVNVPGVPVPYPDGLPMPAQTIMFIESTKYGQPQAIYLLPEDLDQIKIEKNAVVVKMKYE